MIQRVLLWLAYQLHVNHANEAVRGPSKGPEDALLRHFREIFGFIDLQLIYRTLCYGHGQLNREPEN